MARLIALTLLIVLSVAMFACGGDDDTDSPTGQSDDATEASGEAPTDPADEAWSGAVSGPISGEFANTLPPQCGASDEIMVISLQGVVGEQSVVVSIVSVDPGTFDFSHPQDASPTVDIATTGDPPAEWYGAAGAGGSGELTLEDDGSGTANVTIPTIVTGSQEDITFSGEWTCPAQ